MAVPPPISGKRTCMMGVIPGKEAAPKPVIKRTMPRMAEVTRSRRRDSRQIPVVPRVPKIMEQTEAKTAWKT